MAVGKHFIYALDASDYMVYRRNAAGAPVTATPAVPHTGLEAVFAAQIQQLNNLSYPAWSGISCTGAGGGNPLPLNQVGCIGRPYDDDAYYDPQTGRFWIMAKLRPSIGACKGGLYGYTTANDPNTCISVNPQTHQLLSPADLKQLVRRFIVLAVSRPGAASSDPEDPANGFYTYLLTDTYGDWSQLMVHNGMVLLNYRDFGLTKNDLWVFGAHDLMGNGLIPDHAFLPQPSAHFTAKDFNVPAVDWVNNKTVDVTLKTSIMFVKQQSDDKVTYLVAANDGKLVVYGLKQTQGSTGLMPAPEIIMPAVVDLPSIYPLETVPAAYANGYLYWAFPDSDGSRQLLRTFRWELHQAGHTWNGVHPIFISNTPESNYLEADIGVGDTARTYELPTMNVTPSGAILTMYHTRPNATDVCASVHYAVIPPGATNYSSSRIICTGSKGSSAKCASLDWQGNPGAPQNGGVLDIVSVATDPLTPGQLFMSNACSNGSGYKSVIAAVKPCDPLKECGSKCVDTSSDVANCGICGKSCGAHQVCSGGTCANPPKKEAKCPPCVCLDGSKAGPAACAGTEACVHICRGHDKPGN